MREVDLWMMSALIFLPAIFGTLLLVFPRKAVEAMRWWALLGSAATFVLSCCIFIDFYHMLDGRLDANGKPLRGAAGQLESRTDELSRRLAASVPEPRDSDDWVTRLPWIEHFRINYSLGLDGMSMALVLLTTLVGFLAVLASWTIDRYVQGYLFLLMVLQSGVLGAFLALDLFLFYVFYELMLVPMYFLVGIWGGPYRERAAIKFFVYTLFGSVLILVAILMAYSTDLRDFVPAETIAREVEQLVRAEGVSTRIAERQVKVHTFDILTLHKAGRAAYQLLSGKSPEQLDCPGRKAAGDDPEKLAAFRERMRQPFFTAGYQYALFLLLFVGFAVKVPLFPLHSWLPDAHVEAPTPISMVLAGVLLKLGGYGLFRLAYPVAPWAAEQLAWYVAAFGTFNIAYGALVAMGQTDFKKLLAYSSISHMGYVVLGLAVWSGAGREQFWALGASGAMFQMLAHGITATALFFVVGVVYERAHHRDLTRFGGIMEPMPIYSGLSTLLLLASMGLPGLCGFVGELMVLLATWNFSPILAIIAILTTVITAGYILWTFQRVFLGTNPETAEFPDLSLRELICLFPMAVLAILLGILPQPLVFSWMEPSVSYLIEGLAKLGK